MSPGNEPGDLPRTSAAEGTERREGQDTSDQASSNLTRERLTLSKAQLQAVMESLVLENPNNRCFANSACLTFVSATLTTGPLEPAFWGLRSQDITDFIAKAGLDSLNLASAQFCRDILTEWGAEEIIQLNFSIAQRDAAEFIQVWLRMIHATPFEMQWEKRMAVGKDTVAVDMSRE